MAAARRRLRQRRGCRMKPSWLIEANAFGAAFDPVKAAIRRQGMAWALVQPLAFLAIFAVFFGRVAKIGGDGVPYAAFALTALIPWNYVSTTVSFGANALLSDASLVRKVYFPREVPVLAAAVASFVDFSAGLVAFLILGPILGIDDPRTSDRIEFIGGIRGTAELERRVHDGSAAIAFSMFPTTVAQLMAIADAGQIMPPKSTWFEPKLRDGLLMHGI